MMIRNCHAPRMSFRTVTSAPITGTASSRWNLRGSPVQSLGITTFCSSRCSAPVRNLADSASRRISLPNGANAQWRETGVIQPTELQSETPTTYPAADLKSRSTEKKLQGNSSQYSRTEKHIPWKSHYYRGDNTGKEILMPI